MRTAKKVVKEPEIKFHIGQIIPGNRKITDIKFSPRQLLIETKITIYCMECKKKTDYAYKTINNIANGDGKIGPLIKKYTSDEIDLLRKINMAEEFFLGQCLEVLEENRLKKLKEKEEK